MFIDRTTLTTTIDITATTAVTKQPFATFPVFTSLSGPCNTLDVETINEGNYSCMHKDPLKKICTDYRYWVQSHKERCKRIDQSRVLVQIIMQYSMAANVCQILTLFNEDMNTAVSCASSWLKRWSSLGVASQSAIADMAFNMGCTINWPNSSA